MFRRGRGDGLPEFFLLAFAFSWGFWLLEVLVVRKLVSMPPLLEGFLLVANPAPFGPTVAAVFLSHREGGLPAVKALLGRALKRDFAPKWWIPILLLFPFLSGVALLVSLALGEALPEMVWGQPGYLAVAFVYILLLGGPLEEEFGWRGFALDRLQSRWSALASALALGVAWGLWHLPLVFIPGSIQSQVPFAGFFLLVVVGSVFFTWVYNNTGGSLLAAILLHTMVNFSFLLFPVQETALGGLCILVVDVLALGVLLGVYGVDLK